MLGPVKERGRGALPDFQCVERFITYEAKEGVVIVDIVDALEFSGALDWCRWAAETGRRAS